MRLMTAHRILIVTAILFFLGYAAWEVTGISAGRGSALRGALAGSGALALALYFRTLKNR